MHARARSCSAPRAWWHEVESTTDCFKVNFGIKGTTWASGLSLALGDVLNGETDAREYCCGALAVTAAAKAHAATRFEQLKRQAIRHLEALTLEEVYLAGKAAAFEWAPHARSRAIVETAGGWALDAPELSPDPMELDPQLVGLIRKLVALKHRFGWGHLAVIAREEIRGDIGRVGLWNLLADLVDAGYLVRFTTDSA